MGIHSLVNVIMMSWYSKLTLFSLVFNGQQSSPQRLTHLISRFKTHELRLGQYVTLLNTKMYYEAVTVTIRRPLWCRADHWQTLSLKASMPVSHGVPGGWGSGVPVSEDVMFNVSHTKGCLVSHLIRKSVYFRMLQADNLIKKRSYAKRKDLGVSYLLLYLVWRIQG